MKIDLRFGDTIEQMKLISDKSIDFICTDLPYQKTKNSWDTIIPFNSLWEQYERIIKQNGAIALFSQGTFMGKLMLSNENMFRYDIVWEKTTPTNPFNAKIAPLRSHENILIFYKSPPTYNPQKTTGHPRKVSTAQHKRNSKKTTNYGDHEFVTYDSTERYPKSVWKFATDKQKESLHPTQKPVLLIEELIKTYTNEGELVLDNTFGSCTTGIACINTNRNFIGIENSKEYFDISIDRINRKRAESLEFELKINI